MITLRSIFRLSLLTLLTVGTVRVSPVLAQETATQSASPTEPLNVTLSPVTIRLETDPGKQVSSQIRIRNNSTMTELLELSVGKFTADASGGRPMILDTKPNDEEIGWITFTEKKVSILPGEWKTIPFTFSPPEEAALSYFYTLQVTRPLTAKSDGTAITGVPTILLLADVNSPFAKRELVLDDFSVEHQAIEYTPQNFSIKIKNTGNVHAVPTGNIFIDGQGQKDLAVLSLNPAQSSILPQTTREFTVQWNDGFPRWVEEVNQQGEKKHRLEWDFSKAHLFRFGRFTAHLLLVYDNGTRDVPIESSVTFWVLPWKLFLLTLLIIIFTLLGLRSTLKSVYSLLRARFSASSRRSL